MRSSNPRHAVSRHGSATPRSESHNAGEAVCDPAPMCRGTEAAALRVSVLCLTHLHTSPLPSGELSFRAQYSATTTRPQMHPLRVKIATSSQSASPFVAARVGNGHLRKRTGIVHEVQPPLAIDELNTGN